jgi:UDP-GlcNAc3NAcA epimerase
MPEELNRVLTDHASDLLFAPTAAAVANLRAEGIPAGRIRQVGDVMYDAALYYSERAGAKREILDRLGVAPEKYVLATVHRAENTDEPGRLAAAFGGLETAAADTPVVLPLHPRTRAALERDGLLSAAQGRLKLTAPVSFLEMVCLEKNARLIVTDSGGVQKEAFFHRVPCVTLRDETEWIELVELGWNRLVPPTSADSVAGEIRDALGEPPTTTAAAPYGDGRAGGLICEALTEAR